MAEVEKIRVCASGEVRVSKCSNMESCHARMARSPVNFPVQVQTYTNTEARKSWVVFRDKSIVDPFYHFVGSSYTDCNRTDPNLEIFGRVAS